MCLAAWSCSTPCNPMDYSLPGSSVHGDSPGKNTGVGCHASPGHLPDLGTEPRSPTLQADSLPSEPAGKPMNTGVGSLSLLQGIFPTQGLNTGLPHCRWILYHLSQQGSPWILEWIAYHFSRGASWWRNQTRVFSIASGFLTSWATRETLIRNNNYYNIIENIPSVSCKYFLGELSH